MPRRKVSNLSSRTRNACKMRNRRKKRRDEQMQQDNENERVSMYVSQLRAFQSQEARAERNWQRQLERRQAHWAVDTQNTAEEKQQTSISVTDECILPVIKTEILDPSEQNQEFILPDYPQSATNMDSMSVTDNNIQDSSEMNNFLLPYIKAEPTEIDDAWRIEEFSGSNNNIEIENSLFCKHKLTKCFVLLHDCLVPENLASISAKFKHLKINTDVSGASSKDRLFLLSDALFLPHISETYGKPVACRKEPTPKRKRIIKKKFKKKKVSTPKPFGRPKKVTPVIHLKTVPLPVLEKKQRRISRYKKYTCNCFKVSEDAITLESSFGENNFESAQQLCSCFTNDYKLSDPIELLKKEASFFDPDFGKITSGMNRIN